MRKRRMVRVRKGDADGESGQEGKREVRKGSEWGREGKGGTTRVPSSSQGCNYKGTSVVHDLQPKP